LYLNWILVTRHDREHNLNLLYDDNNLL